MDGLYPELFSAMAAFFLRGELNDCSASRALHVQPLGALEGFSRFRQVLQHLVG